MFLKKIIMLVVLLIATSACAVYHQEGIILTDPSWLRVAIYNNSPYTIKLEGVVEGTMPPYTAIRTNLGCRGTFWGIAHAYKEVGRNASGTVHEMAYMGEQRFTLYMDGRNFVYNGESLDAYATLNEGSFYAQPNVFGEKTHVLFQQPCSPLAPNISFSWKGGR